MFGYLTLQALFADIHCCDHWNEAISGRLVIAPAAAGLLALALDRSLNVLRTLLRHVSGIILNLVGLALLIFALIAFASSSYIAATLLGCAGFAIVAVGQYRGYRQAIDTCGF